MKDRKQWYDLAPGAKMYTPNKGLYKTGNNECLWRLRALAYTCNIREELQQQKSFHYSHKVHSQ
jgi:hypothetical protein